MRKVLIISIVAIALVACKTKPSYIITGKLVNQTTLEGTQVVIGITEGKTFIATDTTAVADGKFEFKGSVEQPAMYMLNMGNSDSLKTDFVLENAEIAISIDGMGIHVSGSPLNDLYQQYKDQARTFKVSADDIRTQYRDLKLSGTLASSIEDSLAIVLDNIEQERDELEKNFVASNINNPAGQVVLKTISHKLSVEDQKELISKADSASLQTANLTYITQRVDALENTAIGKKYTDIRSLTPDNKDIALSDFVGKNKLVLISFWASWYKAGNAEASTLADFYKKYKAKGLEIVSVSLDQTKEDWVNGISELGMTWAQMSDTKGWESEHAKIYGINTLPYVILIDEDGTIVARSFYAKDIDSVLNDLLE